MVENYNNSVLKSVFTSVIDTVGIDQGLVSIAILEKVKVLKYKDV